MRLFLALAAFFFLTTFAPFSLYREPLAPETTLLEFEAVPLMKNDPRERRLGRLAYLGGWGIRSNDPRFGGISAMHVEDRQVTAFSDAGSVIRFQIPPSRSNMARIVTLPEGPGSGDDKGDRDIEAVAVSGPRAWIAFERRNSVWRYDRSRWSSDAAAAPTAMARWRTNAGPEAMVRLPDGRFLIFSEGGKNSDGVSEALLFEGDPALVATKTTSLGYRAPTGYRVTDAAVLPDGSILFLNRAFSLLKGFTAILTQASKPKLHAGSVIEGSEVARLVRPVTTDNMEALSVTSENGRTVVWIASDDNLNPLQRTLLLKFVLLD